MLCACHTKWCQQEGSAIRDVIYQPIEKSLKQGLQTYVAALVEIKEGQTMEVPYSIVGLLQEFADVMPATLPKELPPRRLFDHKIELILRSKPLAQAPYRMPLVSCWN